jgi:hypothetical protein
MARTPPSRVNLKRITDNLRLASRKGDRAALTLALDQMKTLALSPRYWEKYLRLLRNPTARLVDLLVIKQGERIAYQKGRGPAPEPPPSAGSARATGVAGGKQGARRKARGDRRKGALGSARGGEAPRRVVQPSLFD